MVEWEYVGLALTRGADGEFDSQTLSTGSVIRRNGRFWIAYSGIRKGENPPTRKVHRVGMAVSDDLYHWTKHERNPVNQRDPRFYERLGPVRRAYGQWRDPFLFDAGDRVYQYVCARSWAPDRERRGTVGLAASRDMANWQVGPPLQVEPVARELEVPQVYRIDRRYYLVFCTPISSLTTAFMQGFPGHLFRRGDYSMVGDSPSGPFEIHGTGEILAEDAVVKPYASRLVRWDGQWVLIGTVREGGATFLCDPIPVVADATGVHAAGP
jgi:beta-fructofuranosidase